MNNTVPQKGNKSKKSLCTIWILNFPLNFFFFFAFSAKIRVEGRELFFALCCSVHVHPLSTYPFLQGRTIIEENLNCRFQPAGVSSKWGDHRGVQQLDYMTDSDTAIAPRFSMSGECSGAAADGSPSSLTSLSSAPSSRLAVRSTKYCKSPAPKASPSTFSTVQVRSLNKDRMDGKQF